MKGAVADSWDGKLRLNLNSRARVKRLTGGLPIATLTPCCR